MERPRTEAVMCSIAETIDKMVNPVQRGKPAVGFCVLIFPLDTPAEGPVDSISNLTMNDLIAVLKRQAFLLEQTLQTKGPPH